MPDGTAVKPVRWASRMSGMPSPSASRASGGAETSPWPSPAARSYLYCSQYDNGDIVNLS